MATKRNRSVVLALLFTAGAGIGMQINRANEKVNEQMALLLYRAAADGTCPFGTMWACEHGGGGPIGGGPPGSAGPGSIEPGEPGSGGVDDPDWESNPSSTYAILVSGVSACGCVDHTDPGTGNEISAQSSGTVAEGIWYYLENTIGDLHTFDVAWHETLPEGQNTQLIRFNRFAGHGCPDGEGGSNVADEFHAVFNTATLFSSIYVDSENAWVYARGALPRLPDPGEILSVPSEQDECVMTGTTIPSTGSMWSGGEIYVARRPS